MNCGIDFSPSDSDSWFHKHDDTESVLRLFLLARVVLLSFDDESASDSFKLFFMSFKASSKVSAKMFII